MRRWLLVAGLLVACDSASPASSFRDGESVPVDPPASFILPPDAGVGEIPYCHPGLQDCPAGDKCTWWANDGGPAWNATRCVPVEADPAVAGESCEGGGPLDGVDACERGSMCFSVDEMGQGTCTSLCVGDDSASLCEDPDEVCVESGSGLALCLSGCDPLAPQCPAGQGCYPLYPGPVCLADASGDAGAAGDPCGFASACDPGLVCAGASLLEECMDGSGCCTEPCDLRAPVCPDPLTCVAYYDDRPAAPDHADLGVCVSPA
jgi:hypothetical protein